MTPGTWTGWKHGGPRHPPGPPSWSNPVAGWGAHDWTGAANGDECVCSGRGYEERLRDAVRGRDSVSSPSGWTHPAGQCSRGPPGSHLTSWTVLAHGSLHAHPSTPQARPRPCGSSGASFSWAGVPAMVAPASADGNGHAREALPKTACGRWGKHQAPEVCKHRQLYRQECAHLQLALAG